MNARLSLMVGLLFSLLIIAIVTLSLFDKSIPDYLVVPLSSLGVYLVGLITKHPNDKEDIQ